MSSANEYLQPYLRAVRRHGVGVRSLLWASSQTQAMRFDAIVRCAQLEGMSLLDAGCGTADLLDYLLARDIRPSHYVGLEAVSDFAAAARKRDFSNAQIVEADFVAQPARMLVGADAVIFCGSLNTLSAEQFYRSLEVAHGAAGQVLIFNFLCSTNRAGADWLTWHDIDDVARFFGGPGRRIEIIDDYLEGDCTMAVWKNQTPL